MSVVVARSVLPGGIALLEVKGSLLGGQELDELREALNGFIRSETRKLVLDIDGVDYINSAAVGVLVSALISYTRRGWQIRLCGRSKEVYSILAITKLNRVFEMHETREEAVTSFGERW
jgi:anti-sigma B factor antagonist